MRKIVMLDDLDKESEADETLSIFIDGYTYVLDLAAHNADRLRATLQPFLDAAHDKFRGHEPPASRRAAPAPPGPVKATTQAVVPSGKIATTTRTGAPAVRSRSLYEQLDAVQRREVRAWCNAEGVPVHHRGSIKNEVIEQWLQSKGVA